MRKRLPVALLAAAALAAPLPAAAHGGHGQNGTTPAMDYSMHGMTHESHDASTSHERAVAAPSTRTRYAVVAGFLGLNAWIMGGAAALRLRRGKGRA